MVIGKEKCYDFYGHPTSISGHNIIWFIAVWYIDITVDSVALGGMCVTSAWSPLGNFIEGQAHPNVLLILCFSHVITYGSRVFSITFQSI